MRSDAGPFPPSRAAGASPPGGATVGRIVEAGALPAAAAVWLGLFATLGLQGFNLREDGYLLTLAERVVRGEVPYRDFSYIRPPLPVLVQAALLAVVPGYAVAASRWYFALQGTAVLAALAALLARLGLGRPQAALVALLGVVAALTGGWAPMPWHTTDGIGFAVLAAWALVAAAARGAWPLAALAGAAAAAAALSKQGFAVVALAGAALALQAPGRRIGRAPWSGVLAYLAGAGVLGAGVGGYLAWHGALGAMLRATLLGPGEIAREVLRAGPLDLALTIHLPTPAGVAGGLALLAFVALPLPAARLPLAFGGLASLAAAAWRGASPGLVYRVFLVEPVYAAAWLGGLGLLGAAALGRRRLAPAALWVLVLGLCTLYASSWSYVARRSAALGVVLVLAPVLVLVADAASAGRPEPARRAAHVAAATALLYAALLAAALHTAVPYLDAGRADLRTPFATARLRGIRSSPLRVAGVDGVVGLVRRETRPGEYVLAFPDFPALYFLAERPNPTRVDWFLPEELTGAEVRQVLTDLGRRPPRLVVVTALNPRQMRENRRLRPVLAHLLAHYVEWVSIGEFLVFRPRGGAGAGSAGPDWPRPRLEGGGPPRPRAPGPGAARPPAARRGPGQEV